MKPASYNVMASKCVFFITAILFALCSSAQPVIPRFDILGVNQGLSQSSVYAIYQDKIGYMWFGTADGLNRYDGKEIKVYKPVIKNPQNGFSNFVRGNIVEDKNQNIWYVNETGIFCYNRLKDSVEVTRNFQNKLFLEEKLVCIDTAQTLWLFNINKGITSYNTVSGQTKFYPFPFKISHDLLLRGDMQAKTDNSNIVFALYSGDGYYTFNTVAGQFRHFPQSKSVPDIFPCKDGFALIADDSIVIKTTENIAVRKIPLPAQNGAAVKIFYSLLFDNYGRIWMTSFNNGLFCYVENEKKYYHYVHDNSHLQSLPIDITRALLIDRDNNLWIGTDGGGVCRLNLKPAKFNLFPMNEGDYHFLKNYFTKCFYEDEKGKVYVGTLNGLNIFNPQNYSVKNYTYNASDKNSLPGNYVSAVFKDSKKRIWISGSLGAALFDEATGKFRRIKLPGEVEKVLQPANYFVYRFIQTSDGDIAAATEGGLAFFSIDEKQHIAISFPKAPGFVTAITTDVDEISPGNLWYTSPENGLYHIQKINGEYIFKEKFFPDIDLRCIHPDEENKEIIWIGSGIGLIRFDTKARQSVVYNEKDGLSNGYVYGILEDEKHNLWMSTNGGIFMFNKKTKLFTPYTADYGLQSNEFNTGAYYKSPGGNFYFGGIKGFNWFKPSQVVRNFSKPVADISQVSVNDSVRNNDTLLFRQKKLNLFYNQNDVTFKVASLDFTRPGANKFRYQLQGWDKKFVTTDNNIIRYSRLPPGRYIFMVTVSNSDNVWSDEQKIFITISPPFWKTWWFYTLMIVSGILIVFFVVRESVQRKLRAQKHELEKQKALEEERKRIGREMHDDIGAGLTQITLMSEAATHKTQPGGELQDIAATGRKLVNSMSEIIWSLNAENKTTEQLFAYLREQLNGQLEYSGMESEICFAENVNSFSLSNQQKRNIILVTKEIVNNAIKYSHAKNILIAGDIKNNHLLFEIKDDGVGFDAFKARTGNGLRNIRHRIEELNGELKIQSEADKGTLLRYTIPLK